MNVFKNLLSRLLRHGSAPYPRPARLHRSGRSLLLPSCAAAAAAAFACCSAKFDQNTRAPVMEVTGAHVVRERVSFPDLPRLPPDHPDTIRVHRVAGDIIAAAWDDEVFGQRRFSKRTGRVPLEAYGDLKVQWNVIDSWSVRACVNISSEIFISAGIMEYLGDDVAHIAAVLVHEVIYF